MHHAFTEVFKDKNLELLLKYSRVLFLESSLESIKIRLECPSLPCGASDTFCLHLFLSYIKYPDKQCYA